MEKLPDLAGQATRSTELLRGDEALRVRCFRLTVVDGPDAGATFVSSGKDVVLGTHARADLRLSDRSVSRLHCELAVGEGGVVVRDLESTNGTSIGGVAVMVARLDGDALLQVGRTRIKLELDAHDTAVEVANVDHFGQLSGCSSAMRRVFSALAAAARTDSTVLILGETGTGKELAAESLHRESRREGGPFVVVDCAALPSMLLDSELFGHVAGAFTGAVSARRGAFEAASGGTLFLDEIGELAPELQPKLLRVLEQRKVKPVGSNTWRPVDVRVLAATHRDLRPEVNRQTFRADLYYRLAVVDIALPPLRERHGDIPLLIESILDDLGKRHTPEAELLRSPQTVEELRRHHWAGNVRELRNYIETCLAFNAVPPPPEPAPATAVMPDLDRPFLEARDQWLRDFERPYLGELLRRHDGNVSATARAAGVDRTYLYKLLSRHGLR